MLSSLKQECQEQVEHQNIQDYGSEVIMDEIMFFKILLAIILQYFELFLYTPQQYFMTVKLCKWMFLGPY